MTNFLCNKQPQTLFERDVINEGARVMVMVYRGGGRVYRKVGITFFKTCD